MEKDSEADPNTSIILSFRTHIHLILWADSLWMRLMPSRTLAMLCTCCTEVCRFAATSLTSREPSGAASSSSRKPRVNEPRGLPEHNITMEPCASQRGAFTKTVYDSVKIMQRYCSRVQD